jgi:hypothetical protein
VSFGNRLPNRMIPSLASHAPATITTASTSSALTRIEPRIAVSATTRRPAFSAKMTTKNSGRLPSVDCIAPVAAGPSRCPTCSVANDTIHVSPASAIAETTNASTAETPVAYRSTPAMTVASAMPAIVMSLRRLSPRIAPQPLPTGHDGVVV